MKIIRFCLLLFSLVLIVNGASIQFSNQYIFYGIGADTISGYWEISRIKNDLSNQDIGTFDPYTQLWLNHHQFSIYMSEGDSVNSYTYLYRYFLKDGPPSDWIQLYPDYFGQAIHTSGYWYATWALNSISLFNLPQDTGEYCLEFSFSASVRDLEGDTLESEYISADSLPLICYFNVIDPGNSSSEPPLSICLTSFYSRQENGKVYLVWITASESENSHFLVYRDGAMIGRVAGNGTCTDPHEYSFVDNMATPGVHDYAIADVTYGGEEVMHESITVESPESKIEEKEFILNKAYPNPFNPSITINYQLSTINKVRASVYNTNGEPVANLLNKDMLAGTHKLTWNANGMPSGVYIVTMVVENTVQSQKIVLMK